MDAVVFGQKPGSRVVEIEAAAPQGVTRANDGCLYLWSDYGFKVSGYPWKSLVRLRPDGSIDEGFQAVVSPSRTTAPQESRLVVLTKEQELLVLMSENISGSASWQPSWRRLKQNGAEDTSFAGPQALRDRKLWPHSIAVVDDGAVYLGVSSASQNHPGLVRVLPDGRVDDTFRAPVLFGSFSRVEARLADGRLLVSGYSFPGNISVADSNLSAESMVRPLLTIGGELFQPTQILTMNPDGSFWAMEARYPQDGSPIRARLACLQELQEGEWERIVADAHIARLWARSEKGKKYELQASEDLASWQTVGREVANSCRIAWEVATEPGKPTGFFRLRSGY